MPCAPRDQNPGIHHVWVNATGNWPYFIDGVDRIAWVRLLVRVLDRYGWSCLAFCQMTTHFHLLVNVADNSLPRGMQYLNREYGKDFNDRHSRYGHFVRRRYGSRRVKDGRDLLGVYAYVVLNPVREAMCHRPEDWRWSSYATTIGQTHAFPFVDAGLVLAELGGSVAALRVLVDARAERRVSAGHVRYQIPDVAPTAMSADGLGA
jgi:REP element-mobilizing transposase RayT